MFVRSKHVQDFEIFNLLRLCGIEREHFIYGPRKGGRKSVSTSGGSEGAMGGWTPPEIFALLIDIMDFGNGRFI